MKSVLNFVLSIVVTLFSGLILSKMWGWFIVSKFGVPSLSVVEAVGVMFVASFLLSSVTLHQTWADVKEASPKVRELSPESYALVKTIVSGVMIYPFVLLGAYVWHLFLP